jgi:hypothetical protein
MKTKVVGLEILCAVEDGLPWSGMFLARGLYRLPSMQSFCQAPSQSLRVSVSVPHIRVPTSRVASEKARKKITVTLVWRNLLLKLQHGLGRLELR